MFATKCVARALPQARLVVQQRNMSVLSGPARVRISTAEKIAHGLVIAGCMLAIPAWVLVNIKNYKRRE